MKKSIKSILKVFVAFLSLMPFWVFAEGTYNEYVYKFITPDGGEEKIKLQTSGTRIRDQADNLLSVTVRTSPEGGLERTDLLTVGFAVLNNNPQIMTTTDLDQLANIFSPRLCNCRILAILNQWTNFLPWPLSNGIFLYLDQQANNLNSLLFPSGLQRRFRIPTFINPANFRARGQIDASSRDNSGMGPFGDLSSVTVTGIRQQTPTETTFSVEAPHFRGGRTYGSITVNRRAEVTHANFGLYGSVTLISSSYDVPNEQPRDSDGNDSDYGEDNSGIEQRRSENHINSNEPRASQVRTGPCEACGCPSRGVHRSDYQ